VTGRHRGPKRKRMFADTWRPLVSVIALLYYVTISCHPVCPLVRGTPQSIMLPIFFSVAVWYRTLSLCYVCIQSSGIILIP